MGNYRNRLIKAINVLEEMLEGLEKEANSGHPDSFGAIKEQVRVKGKIAGFRLALSYLDEETW